MENKTLAMVGPIEVAEFLPFLDLSQHASSLPQGLGGSPVNLLCRELLSRGWSLLIVTLSPDVEEEIILEGKNLKICIGRYTPRARTRALNFFAIERAFMLKVLKRERPAIVHAQWAYEFALAAQASGLPHVITAHDAPLSILRIMPDPYRVIRTLMAYRVLARARRVVSVAPYVASHLKRFMLYRGSAEVIPNGMPEKLFSRTRLSPNSSQPIAFATILNGWASRKNGQVAIQAFAKVREIIPNARLLMFGADHGPGEEAQQYAQANGLQEGVEFVGEIPYQNLMDQLSRDVDILVHPALEEANSMVLIEAMALGIPVIGGDRSGGVPWTLGDGAAGLLIDIQQPDAVARAMLELAQDTEARNELGERGKKHARENFHISVIANSYEAIYRELMADAS